MCFVGYNMNSLMLTFCWCSRRFRFLLVVGCQGLYHACLHDYRSVAIVYRFGG